MTPPPVQPPIQASSPRQPSLVLAIVPLVVLVVLLGGAVYLFGEDASAGPNQIGLMVAAGLTAIIGIRLGHGWTDMEEAIAQGISLTLNAMLILLMVGTLIGIWILAGVVPTLIAYGLDILHPGAFYVTACAICLLVSVSIGSSWTTVGTVGVALMGVAVSLGLSPAVTAGAIISGAYFGDKMSPLSDTTNLAAAVTGANLFDHIANMIWTTGPSILIALALFALIGSGADHGTATELETSRAALRDTFNIGWPMLIPLVGVLVLAIRRVAPLPALAAGVAMGAVWAIVFQQAVVLDFGNRLGEGPLPELRAIWTALFGGYIANSGVANLDALLSRGGMESMLNTIWLIMAAMTFGSVMEKTGMLARIVRAILSSVRRTGSLIAATVGVCIGTNIVAADQYMTIVAPGRMFRDAYQRAGLSPRTLSRTLEDSGTITSPLVPWNTCGAYMAATLGVATFTYLPFCFFNLINPFIAILFGYINFKVERITPSDNNKKLSG